MPARGSGVRDLAMFERRVLIRSSAVADMPTHGHPGGEPNVRTIRHIGNRVGLARPLHSGSPPPGSEPASGESDDDKGCGDVCAKDDPVRCVKRGRVGVLLRHEDEVVLGGREAGV